MDAIQDIVEGWVARDAVLLRVWIFLRDALAIVQVKEKRNLKVFEKMEGSWVLDGWKECNSDQNDLYL